MEPLHVEPPPAEIASDSGQFVYAGVAFDVACAPDLRFALGAEHRDYRAPFSAGPVAASVRVALAPARELAGELAGREIVAEWRGAAGAIRTCRVRAEVRQLSPRSFAARGLVSPDANGCSSLCTGLAGAILDRVGGVVLHASGVEVDGGVVLFVGPSTAGKTTAASHCAGARAYARDRAAAYPTPAGWHAAPMCGGDEIPLPSSTQRVLPLRGVLRVVKDRCPSITDASTSRAVGILRESAQMTDRSVEGELDLLDRLTAMSAEVRVGVAHTVLGRSLLGDLRAWLGGAS